MTTIDKSLISRLFEEAAASPRLRMNFDLRTSPEDGSQRMLNAMLEPTLIFEAKDGRFGEDGSEFLQNRLFTRRFSERV